MKKNVLSAITAITMLYGLLFSLNAQAIYWEIYGPCSNKAAHAGKQLTDIKLSIGEITVEILDYNKIPYEGTELNFSSIYNSPTGLEAMEVISDTEMRAHGWCYSLNGVIPDVMPNHTYPSSQNDHLIWFYGYYTNKDNVWLPGPCMPTYDIKPEQFCGKK